MKKGMAIEELGKIILAVIVLAGLIILGLYFFSIGRTQIQNATSLLRP